MKSSTSKAKVQGASTIKKEYCTHPDREREGRGEVGIWICKINGSCEKETSRWGEKCEYNSCPDNTGSEGQP